MKRLFVAALLLGLASTARAQVAGSSHDLTLKYTAGTDQVCVYCHTPHNALIAVPLWNHASTAETFTPYSSSTMSVTPGQPAGISKMCLSCHDGATNLDAYGGGAGTSDMTTEYPGSAAIVGTDLSDDHPISILYNFPTEGGLNDPAGAGFDLPLYGTGGDQVECGSCHNPHDQDTNGNFLRKSNAASAICTTCHNK